MTLSLSKYFCNNFCLKILLFWYCLATLALFCYCLLCISFSIILNLRHISCRQHINGSYFLIWIWENMPPCAFLLESFIYLHLQGRIYVCHFAVKCIFSTVSIWFLCCLYYYYIFKIYFIDYAITADPFPPFIPLHTAYPLPPPFPPFSSCPWVVHINSLASVFYVPLILPILCTFSPSLPIPLPHW